MMDAALSRQRDSVTAYVAVTAAYWAFMLTDGALRMLVLLHFHTIGFSPIQLAYLFVLYEVAGMVTNLVAGWLAARFGMTSTLFAGLFLQIGALLALAGVQADWIISFSVMYVMIVQGLSGVAKDLAKMSSKSAVKVLAPEGEGRLFRMVAWLTGSKNVVKGLGFLVGAALLGALGYRASILWMAMILSLILTVIILFMPEGLPKGEKGARLREVFRRGPGIGTLSMARMFLFGARDVWFVVGVPLYFYGVFSDGSVEGNRQAFFLVGGFMSAWVIFYGMIQAAAPKLLRAHRKTDAQIARSAATWAALLALVPAALAGAVVGADFLDSAPWLPLAVLGGLALFGFVFAINSSIHSFLVLALSPGERVTMDVGFYYMSNAAGRLIGTLLSGFSYQMGGLSACLGTAAVMVALSWVFAQRLRGVVGGGAAVAGAAAAMADEDDEVEYADEYEAEDADEETYERSSEPLEEFVMPMSFEEEDEDRGPEGTL